MSDTLVQGLAICAGELVPAASPSGRYGAYGVERYGYGAEQGASYARGPPYSVGLAFAPATEQTFPVPYVGYGASSTCLNKQRALISDRCHYVCQTPYLRRAFACCKTGVGASPGVYSAFAVRPQAYYMPVRPQSYAPLTPAPAPSTFAGAIHSTLYLFLVHRSDAHYHQHNEHANHMHLPKCDLN